MVSWATSDVFNRNLRWGGVRNVLVQTSGTSFSNVFYADSIQTFITNQICSNYFITKIIGDLNVSSFGLYVFCLLVSLLVKRRSSLTRKLVTHSLIRSSNIFLLPKYFIWITIGYFWDNNCLKGGSHALSWSLIYKFLMLDHPCLWRHITRFILWKFVFVWPDLNN